MTKTDRERQRKAPILRFKGFTDAWEQRKLGTITDTYSGGTPQVSVKDYYSNNEIPFIRSSDIHKNKTELYISSKGLENSSAKLVSKGHILYALYGATSGEVDVSKIDGAINQAVLCINAHNDLNYFLMLFLSKNKDKIVRKYIQGGQGNLSASIIKKIKVFTTSKLEETKISNLVKILSDIIALYEMKKQLLTQLKQGIVNFLITKNGQKPQLRFSGFNNNWESKSFEKLLNYEQPTKYIVKKADYISQGTPVLTANKSFILGYTNETNIYQNIPAIIFDDFTLESKYVDFPFMVKSSAIKILTSKNSNLFFIYQLLNNQRFVQEGHSRHYISVVQKKKVLVPSIQEQNKIGNLIKQLENNIEQNSNTISLLKRLKKFLLQSMFL